MAFKPIDFQIKIESDLRPKEKILKLDNGVKPVIKSFEVSEVKGDRFGSYEEVKSRFGSLAVTDRADKGESGTESQQAGQSTKDSSFSINPLLRDALKVDREEKRVIEEQVQHQLTELAAKTRAEAEAKGYEEGRKRGYDAAYGVVQSEVATRVADFVSLFSQLDNAKNEIYEANEKFLIEMIYRIAKMVILRELSTDKEYLLRLTKELISSLGVKENIKISLNPKDEQFIQSITTGLDNALGKLQNLHIEVSSQVPPGGCLVETEWHAIDVSVDAQLERIHQSLVGSKVEGAT